MHAAYVRRKSLRMRIQICAMITPGMVLLSRRTTCVKGRSPVARSAADASAFCSSRGMPFSISCQYDHVPTMLGCHKARRLLARDREVIE